MYSRVGRWNERTDDIIITYTFQYWLHELMYVCPGTISTYPCRPKSTKVHIFLEQMIIQYTVCDIELPYLVKPPYPFNVQELLTVKFPYLVEFLYPVIFPYPVKASAHKSVYFSKSNNKQLHK